MKQEQTVLDRIKTEYARLLGRKTFSLDALFSSDVLRFSEFCKGFKPHEQAERLKAEADAFSQRYGTWLEMSRHFINCAWYLYPTADFGRVLTITKNLALGFYLNDVMGRDVFTSLPADEQLASRKIIENMALLDEGLSLAPDAHPLELANVEVLREFRENAPRDWFKRFLNLYCHHLNITHRDRNVSSLGYVPGVYEYIDNRCHYAAVHHLVMWVEYSTGTFLDWEALMRTNIFSRLQRLHWVVGAFPALANDLFSFEGEVIDNDCDSNLVMVMALNDPQLSLMEAIERAAETVRAIVAEIMSTLTHIERETDAMRSVDPELASVLEMHLAGLLEFVKAAWVWQAASKRYKRRVSLWKETTFVPAPVSSAAVFSDKG